MSAEEIEMAAFNCRCFRIAVAVATMLLMVSTVALADT
jgi:hypothetical protein